MRSKSKSISTDIPISVERDDSARFDYPFYLVLIFLFFEYGRPQSFFPIIGIFRPGMFLLLALFFCLISRSALNLSYVQIKFFVLLLLLMAIHIPFATNNYWAFYTFRAVFLNFIVYLSVVNFVSSYPKLQKFIDSWIIINVFCGVVGIINGGKVPNSAFMGDQNDFALVMTMAIPLAYFMFLQADSYKSKLFYLSALGILVAANVASLSRGGFIGLVAVGFFIWLKSPKKLISTVVVAFLVVIFYLSAPPSYLDEVRSIKEENKEEGTGASRWYSWQCGWRMFLDHPIIGVGQGNFPWNFEKYEPPEGFKGRKHGGRAAHSLYFTLIPELGIVGTILFLSLLYYSLKGMREILKAEKKYRVLPIKTETDKDIREKSKKLKHIVLGIQGAFLGYFISGIFLSVLYYPHFWLLIASSLAIANVGKTEFQRSAYVDHNRSNQNRHRFDPIRYHQAAGLPRRGPGKP